MQPRSKPRRQLLIDGDVIAYRAAEAAQKDLEYPEDGFVFRWSFKHEGEAIAREMLHEICEVHGTKDMRVALTECTPMTPNWRNKILPTYKANRTGLVRPQLLAHLRGYLRDNYGAESIATLEADDLLGIWATEPRDVSSRLWAPSDQRIIVTIDKDLRTIPGYFWKIGSEDPEPVVITPEDAVRWHMIQTLAGDRVDGYAGCPGIGVTRAERIIDNPVVLNPQRGVITRGPRKGEETVKWMSQDTDDLWACVVSHYMKEGLTEQDALTTARVAYILRHGDFDYAKNAVRIWEPYR